MHDQLAVIRALITGAGAGVALQAAALPALLSAGVIDRLDGDWALRWVLLAFLLAVAVAAGRLRLPASRGELGSGLVGAGLAMFAWLEVDFHLLHIAHSPTSVVDATIHAAGVVIAASGVALGLGPARVDHGGAQ